MNRTTKGLVAVLLAGVIVAGCGGGRDGAAPAPDFSQSASALVDFINALIAGTSETSDPIDIDPLTLVIDDAGDPAPL